MRPKQSFKILVTSPKGGVGKSTISANLAAFIQSHGQSVTLLDFDNHGSSSSWLKRAPNVGVVIQHHPLPLNQGGNRSLLDARLHLRRAAVSTDVVICDLTWNNSIAGELMFEYDLVIVPTSVSEIELAATVGFLSHHHLMDMHDACGQSFVEFGKAVIETQYIREANQKIRKMQTNPTAPRRSVLERTSSISNRDLLLGRHRGHKAKPSDEIFSQTTKNEAIKPVIGNMVSRFLNRFTAAVNH